MIVYEVVVQLDDGMRLAWTETEGDSRLRLEPFGVTMHLEHERSGEWHEETWPWQHILYVRRDRLVRRNPKAAGHVAA